MLFRFKPVQAFEDCQGNFEQAETSFLQLLTAGGVAVTYGQGTVTWGGASPQTASVTVTHGLGRSPAVIFVTGNTGVRTIAWNTANRTASTFDVSGRTVDGSSPAAGQTQGFDWLVIG